MRFQNLIFILLISITFVGCSSCEDAPKNVNDKTQRNINVKDVKGNSSKTPEASNSTKNNGNANKKSTIGNDAVSVPTPEKTVEAVTLKPLIMAYCDAMRKKDDTALEKLFSRKALQEIKADMKADGIQTISKFFESEPVGNKCEVMNETIQGNTATAYVITETYIDGTPFKFVKENNEWKMTNESDDVDRVEQN